jgi:hypothetical protein
MAGHPMEEEKEMEAARKMHQKRIEAEVAENAHCREKSQRTHARHELQEKFDALKKKRKTKSRFSYVNGKKVKQKKIWLQ